jgi:hypothetical protein
LLALLFRNKHERDEDGYITIIVDIMSHLYEKRCDREASSGDAVFGNFLINVFNKVSVEAKGPRSPTRAMIFPLK